MDKKAAKTEDKIKNPNFWASPSGFGFNDYPDFSAYPDGDAACPCIASAILDEKSESDSEDMDKLRDIRKKYIDKTWLGRVFTRYIYYGAPGMTAAYILNEYAPGLKPPLRKGLKAALRNYPAER